MALSGIKISEIQPYNLSLTPGSVNTEFVVNIANETFRTNLNNITNLQTLNIANTLNVTGGTSTIANLTIPATGLLNATTGTITNLTNTTINSNQGTFTSGLTGNLLGTVTGNLSGNARTAGWLNTTRTFRLTGDIQSDILITDLRNGLAFGTQIQANTISNSNIRSDAAIAGTKIVPDFGAQSITATGNITLSSSDPSSSPFVLVRNTSSSGGSTTSPGFVTRKSRGETGSVQIGDTLGGIFFQGLDNQNSIRTGASIIGLTTGVPGGTSPSNSFLPASLTFQTSPSSSPNFSIERMRITSTGNVGIGTTSPTQRLTVSGNINATGSIDAGTQFLGQDNDTVSAPSFSWTGDTNTGIYSPAADTIGFTTNGVERMRVDTSGAQLVNTNSYGGLNTSGVRDAYWMPNWNDNTSYLNHGANGLNIRNSANASRIFINSAGNVGIGTTSPTQRLTVSGNINATGSFLSETGIFGNAEVNDYIEIRPSDDSIRFFNNNAEHMRLDSNGILVFPNEIQEKIRLYGSYGIGIEGNAMVVYSANRFNFKQSGMSGERQAQFDGGEIHALKTIRAGYMDNSTGSSASITYTPGEHLVYAYGGGTPHFTYICGRNVADTQPVIYAEVGDVAQFEVESDSSVHSRLNSYGALSDISLKQDIIDYNSQWDDIKNIRLRKYRLKTDVASNPASPFLLGVIAQEAEQVSPGLIGRSKQDDVEVKTVKYSILYLKAIKALQEAMARIETLEAKVQELQDI